VRLSVERLFFVGHAGGAGAEEGASGGGWGRRYPDPWPPGKKRPDSWNLNFSFRFVYELPHPLGEILKALCLVKFILDLEPLFQTEI
jgi:hypothetical protein